MIFGLELANEFHGSKLAKEKSEAIEQDIC